MKKRIRRTRRGAYELNLPDQERDMLRSLPTQLVELLDSNDPDLRRLFPPAYTEDVASEAEYRLLIGASLADSHRQALETMAATVDHSHLTEDQLTAWLKALNELRLVLGTRLDVTEDQSPFPEDDPRAPMLALYGYLSWLQDQAVDALSTSL